MQQDVDEAVCAGRRTATEFAAHVKKWTARQYVRHTMTILAGNCRNLGHSTYYTAQHSDAVAKRRYSEARSKRQMQKEPMEALDALVTPLIKKGQPLTSVALSL